MSHSTHKQVIVVRKDLNMKKGKIASQVAHACVATLTAALRDDWTWQELLEDKNWGPWLSGKFTKICVYVNSEKELIDIYDKVTQESFLPNYIIEDSGDTVFHGIPTITCLAIGPGPIEEINKFTEHLPLL